MPVVEPGDTQLFFIFRDATSGKTTYGAGRFLHADPPKDGRVILDFNKAYSPPCAVTPYATCPLPPPQNRLPVAIEAGEIGRGALTRAGVPSVRAFGHTREPQEPVPVAALCALSIVGE